MVGPWQKAWSNLALVHSAVDFTELVRSRRMTRSFASTPVAPHIINDCVSLALTSPSAGKSQGWNMVMLEGQDTARYWDIAFPVSSREGFAFPGLFDAPLIFLVLANPQSYLDRYSEPDKASSGLGLSQEAWVAPYWTIDASFATMTFLLALHDAGLGALFFAHSREADVRQEFSIPEDVVVLGVIAAGYESEAPARSGRSASRPTRTSESVIHRGRWRPDVL